MFNSICQVPKSLPGLGAGPQLWLEYPVVSQSPNRALECHSHSSAAFSLSSPSSQERLQPSDCQHSAGSPPNSAQLRPLHALHPHPLGRGAAPTPFPQRRVPSHGLAAHQGAASTHYPRANPSEPCQGPGNSGCCPWGPSGRSGPGATAVPCQSSWVRRPTRRVLEHCGGWDTRLRVAGGWQGGWHSWHSPPGQSCGCCVTAAETATFAWLLLLLQHPQFRQSPQHPAAPSSTQYHPVALGSPQ